MTVENFVFRENWVVSKVAGTKTTFFATFDPNPSIQIRNSLNSILVKKDRNYIINFVILRLTN